MFRLFIQLVIIVGASSQAALPNDTSVVTAAPTTIATITTTTTKASTTAKPCKNEPATPAIAPYIEITCNATDPNCTSKEDLAKYCSQAKGLVDGGRCFFSGALKVSSWMNGWSVCASKGGVMAQVHTTSDYEQLKLTLMLAGADQSGATGQWIALRRDPSSNTGPYSLDLEKTYWYDGETVYDPDMVVANTWIKTRQTEDPLNPNMFCFITYTAGFNRIGIDNACVKADNGVACMKTTSAQTFKHLPKTCLIASPIKHFTKLTINDCAKKCAQYPNWCRSFNYYCDKSCHLFSWIMADRTEPAANIPGELCKHYTYVS